MFVCTTFGLHPTINKRQTWVACIICSLHKTACRRQTWSDNIIRSLYISVYLNQTWHANVIHLLHTLDYHCRMCPTTNVLACTYHMLANNKQHQQSHERMLRGLCTSGKKSFQCHESIAKAYTHKRGMFISQKRCGQ